jgi:hypothetical protein
MDYIHGIVVVNRPDLLELAVNSIELLWPNAFILDNSPGGQIGLERTWPIPVVRPSVPLSCAQSMNFLFRMACDRGVDVLGYQHNDAEVPPGGAERFLEDVRAANTSGKNWAAMFTSYDILSAYRVDAVRVIGEWDTAFPQPNYHIDVDWFHRARILGFESLHSEVRVTHHNGSSTIKCDPERYWRNRITNPMNLLYYIAKWGGPPHQEQFSTPWNGAAKAPVPESKRPTKR